MPYDHNGDATLAKYEVITETLVRTVRRVVAVSELDAEEEAAMEHGDLLASERTYQCTAVWVPPATTITKGESA